jgi:DNA-binding HxlR family transcriptional regulator
VSKAPKALETRWYEDACGTAHALELVGERWSLLVLRELMFGARRFGELRASLPGISANVLTQRLEGLEKSGILLRKQLPSPIKAQVYELTPWGYESEPILQVMGRWAARSATHDPTLPLSPSSILMSFRTMIDHARAGAFSGTFGFVFGTDDTFCAVLKDGELSVRRDAVEGADVVFTTDPMTLASVVYEGRTFAEAEADGSFAVTGNRALAKRFTTLFRLPPKVA